MKLEGEYMYIKRSEDEVISLLSFLKIDHLQGLVAVKSLESIEERDLSLVSKEEINKRAIQPNTKIVLTISPRGEEEGFIGERSIYYRRIDLKKSWDLLYPSTIKENRREVNLNYYPSQGESQEEYLKTYLLNKLPFLNPSSIVITVLERSDPPTPNKKTIQVSPRLGGRSYLYLETPLEIEVNLIIKEGE